ncbi:MAG: carboxymuconolactone decarboxylase family protein, partial [Pseudomonadota bacterium]
VPGLADYVVGTAYGQIYNRPGLDLKTRQLATVAALTALGGQTGPQLRVHVAASLKSGASETEVIEVILQMSLYGGFPAMINALNVALEVFEAHDD